MHVGMQFAARRHHLQRSEKKQFQAIDFQPVCASHKLLTACLFSMKRCHVHSDTTSRYCNYGEAVLLNCHEFGIPRRMPPQRHPEESQAVGLRMCLKSDVTPEAILSQAPSNPFHNHCTELLLLRSSQAFAHICKRFHHSEPPGKLVTIMH